MKKINLFKLILLAAIVVTSCNRPYDTVFSTYKNGSPKLVFTVVDGKKGEVTRLGEKMYYENGKLMYEKHFDNDRPTGTWHFFYDNGNPHAEVNFNNADLKKCDWKIYSRDGGDFYPDPYDSMRVLELTPDYRPLSVAYYIGDTEMRYQFNDNYTINLRGMVKNGLKEGRWECFYANGQKMLEAQFSGGIENGAYNSYRENGLPYFRGFYINGKRANVWEYYDETGELADRKDFDEH